MLLLTRIGLERRGDSQVIGPSVLFCSQHLKNSSWVFMNLVVHNSAQLRMSAVIFSPLWLLCVLLFQSVQEVSGLILPKGPEVYTNLTVHRTRFPLEQGKELSEQAVAD